MIIVGVFTLGSIFLAMYLLGRYLTEDETKKPHKKIKSTEIEALSEVWDSLKEPSRVKKAIEQEKNLDELMSKVKYEE